MMEALLFQPEDMRTWVGIAVAYLVVGIVSLFSVLDVSVCLLYEVLSILILWMLKILT